MGKKILELKNVTKVFPGVVALDDVSFSLEEGQIHALMGENGAGKSTFIKIITGVHPADEGEMFLEGKKIKFKNPRQAQEASIAAIYQHSTSYPHLSITENIFVGHEEINKTTKTIKWHELNEKARALLDELSLDIEPTTLVGNLTVAEQQVIEIAKAISMDAKIIIMDEPTASLSSRECENLYRITDKLKKEGRSIILISHRFEDMYRLGDIVSILRDGKYMGTWNVRDVDNDKLINAMVGREINQIYPRKKRKIGKEVLRIENFSKTGYFKDINFALRQGEILGFSGLVGAGRTDIMQCIFGIRKLTTGKIYLNGERIKINKPQEALDFGIGLLPEDRQKQGLVLEWEIYKNVSLSNLKHFIHATIVNEKEEMSEAKTLGEKMNLKAPTIYDKANSLSGGNQQKVVICKLLDLNLKVLILDEPTKGVDVGAKSQIYEIMNDLAEKGYGIIMISSDMPELIGMSDRIIAMHEGRITGEFTSKEVTQEKLLQKVMNAKEGSEGERK